MGQQRILGRYPIHFLRTGDSSSSYITGNSIHSSLARLIALQDTNFLRISNNVGFNSFGHGIYLQSGSETNNYISSNLVIQTRALHNML